MLIPSLQGRTALHWPLRCPATFPNSQRWPQVSWGLLLLVLPFQIRKLRLQ